MNHWRKYRDPCAPKLTVEQVLNWTRDNAVPNPPGISVELIPPFPGGYKVYGPLKPEYRVPNNSPDLLAWLNKMPQRVGLDVGIPILTRCIYKS